MFYISVPTASVIVDLGYFAAKASWWGCGQHVPGVMDKVPKDDQCTCEPKVEKEGKKYPPMAAKAD